MSITTTITNTKFAKTLVSEFTADPMKGLDGTIEKHVNGYVRMLCDLDGTLEADADGIATAQVPEFAGDLARMLVQMDACYVQYETMERAISNALQSFLDVLELMIPNAA